jgi:hypothetical protein
MPLNGRNPAACNRTSAARRAASSKQDSFTGNSIGTTTSPRPDCERARESKRDVTVWPPHGRRWESAPISPATNISLKSGWDRHVGSSPIAGVNFDQFEIQLIETGGGLEHVIRALGPHARAGRIEQSLKRGPVMQLTHRPLLVLAILAVAPLSKAASDQEQVRKWTAAASYAPAPCPNPIYGADLDLGPEFTCGYVTVP